MIIPICSPDGSHDILNVSPREFVPLIGVMIYLFFCISPDLGDIMIYSFMYCQSIVKTSGNPYAVYVIVINKCFLATGLPVSQVKLYNGIMLFAFLFMCEMFYVLA